MKTGMGDLEPGMGKTLSARAAAFVRIACGATVSIDSPSPIPYSRCMAPR